MSNNGQARVERWLYASFALFGLVQLLPWNIYMKSTLYFRHRLIGMDQAATVASFMSSGYTLANFFTMVVLVGLQWDEFFIDTRGRIIIGIAGNAILMAAMAFVPLLSISQYGLFITVVTFSAFAGFVTSFMIKGLLGMVARFPPCLTPALLGGQAVAGLAVSIVNAITTVAAGVDNNEQTPTGPFVYFVTGAITLMVALIVFVANCLKSKDFQSYMGISGRNASRESNPDALKEPLQSKRVPLALMLAILKKIKWFALGITVTLATTISIFATFINSPRLDTTLDPTLALLYLPIIFIIYDSGDLIGRWLPAFNAFNARPGSRLPKLFPWLRALIFLPLFLFIAPVPITRKTIIVPYPPFGLIDALYALVSFVFGITNGYCCTLLFMNAPSVAAMDNVFMPILSINSDQSDKALRKEGCGKLMGLFLNIGLAGGALSSFLWLIFLK